MRTKRTNTKFLWVLFTLSISFVSGCKTINEPVMGETVKDVDGNEYRTVIIGSQTWMIENLRTTRYADSTAIPMVSDSASWRNLLTPGYCWYNNDSTTNKNEFGALYNWYTVDTGKLPPRGWHVPTEEDWTTLENNVTDYLYASGSLAKILAATTTWSRSTTMGSIGFNPTINNSSKFTALPGGSRENYIHSFNSIDTTGVWWSASSKTDSTALSLVMKSDQSSVIRFNKKKWNGFSVRCVKDSN